jgi:hypothetical protein
MKDDLATLRKLLTTIGNSPYSTSPNQDYVEVAIDKLIWAQAQGVQQTPDHEAALKARVRNETLDTVLRGLRSEDDSQQLRAIIASIEAMREVSK